MFRRPVYLDCHATTPVDPRVAEAMWPYFVEKFGNAASLNHDYGREAAVAVVNAREQVARLIGAEPEAVVFTSGATESNNLALKGLLALALRGRHKLNPMPHLVTTAAEHRAILDPARRLRRVGCELTILPVDPTGAVDPDDVSAAIRPETALVSVMAANNEVGTISRVAQIGKICRERGVPFHCDAAQAVGRIPIDVFGWRVDLLSISAHKMYGPKGVGALFVRRGEPRIRLEALQDGGGHEQHLRSGTLAVPLIVGFGAACQFALDAQQQEATRLAEMRDRLWDGLKVRIDGIVRNGDISRSLPGTLHVSIPEIDGDVLLSALTEIAVSSSSACTTAEPEPSHVLKAMGISDRLARSSLRFGLGRMTTDTEIDFAIGYVADTIARIRRAS